MNYNHKETKVFLIFILLLSVIFAVRLTKNTYFKKKIPSQALTDKNIDAMLHKLKIDINTATLNQLTRLNGIGEAKAKKIIKYREINGQFQDIKNIQNVKGIGPKIFENIKEKIKVTN